MKLKSTADGLKGKLLNPFEQYGDAMATEYMEFERNNPELPLTTSIPGNTVFEGVEVWQLKHKSEVGWTKVQPECYKRMANNYQAWVSQSGEGFEYRRCYHLLEVQEQVREESAEFDNLHERYLYLKNKEKASNSELGVEELACLLTDSKFPDAHNYLHSQPYWYKQGCIDALKQQQQGLVSIKDVEKVLSTCHVSKEFIQTAINKIKTLKQ